MRGEGRRLRRALGLGCASVALFSTTTVWAAEAGSAAVEEIVITGSRVISNGFEAPTPVSVLSASDLALRGPSGVAESLNTLPQFRGSLNGATSSNQSPARASLGNTVNLRGLGFSRTLILVDGHRLPPTDPAGSIDLDVLPEALVQRVDVVTGGASAAYGSDAVVGVVNYILDNQFQGLKGSAEGGVSYYGDSPSYKVTLSGGTSFGDGRGHIAVSASQYYNAGLLNRNMQDSIKRFGLGLTTITQGGLGNAAFPLYDVPNGRYTLMPFGGRIISGPLSGYCFNPDSSIRLCDNGVVSKGNALISQGGDGGYLLDLPLRTRNKNDSAYAYLSYDITEDIKFHASTILGSSKIIFSGQHDTIYTAGGTAVTIFSDNAFLLPSVKAALGSTTSFGIGRILADEPDSLGHDLNQFINVETGVDGIIADRWHWDVNYSYGFAKTHTASLETYNPNFYAAIDSVIDPASGKPVCRANLVIPGSHPGCVPINLFGLGAPSAAALAYARDYSRYTTAMTMNIVSANIKGDLFQLFSAGPVAAAVGAEYRTQYLKQITNADPSIAPNFTGVRVPAGITTFFNRFNVGKAQGGLNVKEGYAEVNVPIAKGAPLAVDLSLNAAARLTNYSSSGSVVTWKTGVSYAPVEDLRLRGTVSRDIAAPSLYNLTAGTEIRFPGATLDPHTGVNRSGAPPNINAGNPNLVPEKSDTYTAGAVYSPSWASGLTGSIDYYSIDISNIISATTPVQLLNDCEAANGTGPACALIIRPLPFSDRTPANFPTLIYAVVINQAETIQAGFDYDIRYTTPLSNLVGSWGGKLTLGATLNQLLVQKTKPGLTTPFRDDLGVAPTNQKVRAAFTVGYENGPLSVNLLVRDTGSSLRSNTQVFDPCCNTWKNIWYTNLSASYKFMENYEVFVTAQNLFNKKPPIGGSNANPGNGAPSNPAIYDNIGAYYTAGVRFKL